MKIPDKINLIAMEHPLASELAAELGKMLPPETLVEQENSAEVTMLSKALVAVANQSWRIAGAILDPESSNPKSELSVQDIKKIGNALESMKETLGSLGLRVIDRLGQAFNAGLPEHVVTEEPQGGISKEQIIRTIRPTIMWNQTMVQRGEIDIAVPQVRTSN